MKGMAKRENDVIVASTDEFAGDNASVIEAPPAEEIPNNTPAKDTPETVMVRLNRDHKCRIGGKYYVFERLKAYPVPPDVKRVLMKAGMLTAL